MTSTISMRDLLEAGVHFGHQTGRWNPKMAPYIYGARNGVHILDLAQTVTRLQDATEFVQELSSSGQQILFVGTKRQAQDVIRNEADPRQHALRRHALARRNADQLPDHPAAR